MSASEGDPSGKVKIPVYSGFSSGFRSCDIDDVRACRLGSLFWCFDMTSVDAVAWAYHNQLLVIHLIWSTILWLCNNLPNIG